MRSYGSTETISTAALIAFPASLATETEYVRGRLAQYGQDLLNLGLDGLRIDAAKRMCTLNRVGGVPNTNWGT